MGVPEIRTIGVVGLGAMGAGIAQLAIEGGYTVVGREVSDELGEKARERIAHRFLAAVEGQASRRGRGVIRPQAEEAADPDDPRRGGEEIAAG